jgi:hypothetical protein
MYQFYFSYVPYSVSIQYINIFLRYIYRLMTMLIVPLVRDVLQNKYVRCLLYAPLNSSVIYVLSNMHYLTSDFNVIVLTRHF